MLPEYEEVSWLISALAQQLSTCAEVGAHAHYKILQSLDLSAQNYQPGTPLLTPTSHYLAEAVAELMLHNSQLSAALASVGLELNWQEKLEGQAITTLIGQNGTFPYQLWEMGLEIRHPPQVIAEDEAIKIYRLNLITGTPLNLSQNHKNSNGPELFLWCKANTPN